ncbi:MAG: hypothetical protein GY786_20370, partial [Proteobacteria bacterium]|nr:hypothetical protein [Pseudomonadota bacterium]
SQSSQSSQSSQPDKSSQSSQPDKSYPPPITSGNEWKFSEDATTIVFSGGGTELPSRFNDEDDYSEVNDWVGNLLHDNPFKGFSGSQAPWIDINNGNPYSGRFVCITQRQLAWITAQYLCGNVPDKSTGLGKVLEKCGTDAKNQKALYALLSVLCKENIENGTRLLLVKPNSSGDDPPNGKFGTINLCYYNDPSFGNISPCGNGEDFMSSQPGQLMIDIAGGGVGGGGMCDLANTQDESLVIMYPEVLAMDFFSADEQILEPAMFFGVRRYVNTITGDSSEFGNLCGNFESINYPDFPTVNCSDPIGEGSYYQFAFGAVASQALGSCCTTDPAGGTACLNNTDPGGKSQDCIKPNFKKFYNFLNFSSKNPVYNTDVLDVFDKCIDSVATGPWGSGVWWGNSQTYFMILWAACSVAGIPLDYYIYNHFCENPGNQCYVLQKDLCEKCLSDCGSCPPNPSTCGTKG